MPFNSIVIGPRRARDLSSTFWLVVALVCGVPAAPVQYDCSVAIAATIEYRGKKRDVQIHVDMRGYQVDQSSEKIDIDTT